MTPNNTPIDPSVANNFKLLINGSKCIAYRFSVYDTSNNRITPPSGNRVNLSSPLYNGDELSISVAENLLTAGNNYKWQIDLYANELTVSSINTTTDILTISNHNLNTGDIVYIQSTGTLPSGTSAFTIYYIRKISTNEIALYATYEAAKSNGTKVNLTSVGSGTITISNIAISEQIPFSAYNTPTVSLSVSSINTQSYEFVPTYTHSQGIIANKFNAYLADINNNIIDESGEIYSSNVRYTFDGMLNDTTYKVKFDITNAINQTVSTGWINFTVSYDVPSLIIKPTATNLTDESSVLFEWLNAVQNLSVVTGTYSYANNFITSGNNALLLNSGAVLTINNLNIGIESTDGWVWKPNSTSYTGDIIKLEDTNTGNYIKIGYNGTNFYRNINGEVFNNRAKSLQSNKVYLIVRIPSELIVLDFATIS